MVLGVKKLFVGQAMCGGTELVVERWLVVC